MGITTVTGANSSVSIAKNVSSSHPVFKSTSSSSKLVQPSDLVYVGAFRLPDTPGGMGWEWAGTEMGALAYYPYGDSAGPSDGHPGSLYGTGHDQLKYVSEISIPVPVISSSKNPDDLNTAGTLQDFKNVFGGKLDGLELPKIGLAYLPKQGTQTSGKIYYCIGEHIQDQERIPSHGWFELDLSHPQLAGEWKIGSLLNYLTTYYIFPVSKKWADVNTPGMYLATGRLRDGGQGSQGPTLYAYGPWNKGNPPNPGTQLPYVTLLEYSSVTDTESHLMTNYRHSDEWNGGAWLNAGSKSSVIFVGTKGIGNTWYGFSDGTVWPTSGEGPFPPVPDIDPTFYGEELRGWWSNSFQAQILFYDPADLAAVAKGTMEPYEPQPYATLNIDPYLFNLKASKQKDRVGAVTYDSERGFLYVSEPLADGDKTIIHVWKVVNSPSVATIDPANNAVNVALNKVIKVTFTEPVKAGSMFIELKKISSGALIPITKSISGNVLTIKHALLQAATKYTLILHTGCVVDYDGNPLALSSIKFTTTSKDGPYTINQVVTAGKNVKKFIETYHHLPGTVIINGRGVSIYTYFYLASYAVQNIYNKNTRNIYCYTYKGPQIVKETIKLGVMRLSEYIKIADQVKVYMDKTRVTPGYAYRTSLGTYFGYKSMIYMYSKILAIYSTSKVLPASVVVKPWNILSNPNAGPYTNDQVVAAGKSVRNYINTYHQLPGVVTINGKKVSLYTYFYLSSTVVQNIYNKNKKTVYGITYKSPQVTRDTIRTGYMGKVEYIKIADQVKVYMDKTGITPGYAYRTSLGTYFGYKSMIYMYSKILGFYSTNKSLPRQISVRPWSKI